MSKLSLSDIKNGGLVHKTHLVTVEFLTLEEEPASVEIQLKQLPYVQTEKLHKRLPKMIPKWCLNGLPNQSWMMMAILNLLPNKLTSCLVASWLKLFLTKFLRLNK